MSVLRSNRFAQIAAAGVLLVVVTWPIWVFTGSQITYVLATLGAVGAAASLAWLRTPLTVGFLIGVLALLGADVNGTLGAGTPPLHSLRILDVTVLAAAVVAGWAARKDMPPGRSGPRDLVIVALVALAYGALRWLTAGHHVDVYLRTDLRLVAVGILTSFVAWRCRRGDVRLILWSMLVVGVLAALKATAIYASNIYAVGSNDRVQASSQVSLGHLRTILVGGGDTLLILVPTVAIVLAITAERTAVRVGLAIAGLGCLGALGLSGTRTSVLVAFGVAVVASAVLLLRSRIKPTRRTLAIGGVVALCAIGVALLGDAPSRLFEKDQAHTGLSFREDEIDNFFDLSTTDKLLGQGFGGHQMSSDISGHPVESAWVHEFPVWAALKAGVLGLLLVLAALALMIRRGLGAWRRSTDPAPVLVGGAFILGLFVMSLTIDRLALIEGVMLLAVSVLLISAPDAEASSSGRD